MLSKTDASGVTQYAWDFENRLRQATLPNGNAISYKYDALSRRIARIASVVPPLPLTTTTRFIYDGNDVIRDTDGNGVPIADYLNGPGIDNKLRQTTAGAGALYFTSDHLGSTRALTNAAGTAVANITYDSFGNSNGSSLTRYTYTGREFDGEIGLYYYRARWYDSQLGRFISEDPIGFGGGDVNLFGYVWQNPLSNRDPLGLDGWGNDLADWLDKKIGGLRGGLQSDPDAVYFNTAVNFAANTYHGAADMFRVGSGVGTAIYDPCADDPLGAVLQDVGRASSIALTLAGPAAGALRGAGLATKGTTGPSLPEFTPGGKTSGILRIPGGDIPLRSGWEGAASSVPRGTSGFDIVTRTHVEGHAAAVMRQQGITQATVSINNPAICVSCTRLLPRMLPSGSRLTVVLPDGTRVPFTGGP